jgi:uncharacterized protein YecE (DUF72 family)
MKAAERLAHYASRLGLTEVSTTRWFPPTPDEARRWAARTPPTFRFDVQAWSLFTGAATLPNSLWPDLLEEVKPDARDRVRLYREHLSDDGIEECWRRFRASLDPLHAAGRLGCITLRCPHWLKPGRTSTSLLAEARTALEGWEVAVELPHHRWHEGDQAEETLALLEDLDLALICVDAARRADQPEPLLAATADLAVVRFLGRRPGRWTWPYRYAEDELAAWVPTLERLGDGCREVHVVVVQGCDDVEEGQRARCCRDVVRGRLIQRVLLA